LRRRTKFLARIRAIDRIRAKFFQSQSQSSEIRVARPLQSRTRVVLRIETIPGERCTTIRLIGRIQTGHLTELKAQLDAVGSTTVLDLGEVSLVNLEVVRFLSTCESQGIQLLNCSAYIRKWIEREQQR
jgi:hypothetical protein